MNKTLITLTALAAVALSACGDAKSTGSDTIEPESTVVINGVTLGAYGRGYTNPSNGVGYTCDADETAWNVVAQMPEMPTCLKTDDPAAAQNAYDEFITYAVTE